MFRCRTVKPEVSAWVEIEAESPEDAANSYHERDTPKSLTYRHETEGGARVVFIGFARIEVEGHGEMVSKVYHHGIWRKGGVKTRAPMTLTMVAEALGYDEDPSTLLDEWPGEETMEEAEARKSSRL